MMMLNQAEDGAGRPPIGMQSSAQPKRSAILLPVEVKLVEAVGISKRVCTHHGQRAACASWRRTASTTYQASRPTQQGAVRLTWHLDYQGAHVKRPMTGAIAACLLWQCWSRLAWMSQWAAVACSLGAAGLRHGTRSRRKWEVCGQPCRHTCTASLMPARGLCRQSYARGGLFQLPALAAVHSARAQRAVFKRCSWTAVWTLASACRMQP